MNALSKMMLAGALVAAGLGLALLCGAPNGKPQVVQLPLSAREGATAPPGAYAYLPLRAEVNKPILPPTTQAAGIMAPDVAAGNVVLSAAQWESEVQRAPSANAPGWSQGDAQQPPRNAKPQPVSVEPIEALPLTPQAQSSDHWLLQPPAIPEEYSAELDPDSDPTHPQDSPRNWWAEQTPRLSGLNSQQPAADRPEIRLQNSGIGNRTPNTENQPPVLQNSRLQLHEPASANPPKLDWNRPHMNSFSSPVILDPGAPLAQTSTLPATPPAPPRAIAAPTTTPSPVITSGRTHYVADGDTLVRLAERYLRDPARASELYELNRDQLQNPELLPIGIPLRIPGNSLDDDLPALENSASNSTRMVPVNFGPRSQQASWGQPPPTSNAPGGW